MLAPAVTLLAPASSERLGQPAHAAHAMSDPNESLSLPKRTTPTWEMELLLSGATVFAMFQATQAVTEWGARLLPRLADNPRMFASVLFTYGNGALTLLTLAFLLHLALRAYWVALVGINSVYPEGPRFERLRVGPIQRELVRSRWRALSDRIESADNAATVVFALGISLALILVPISAVVTLFYLVAAAGSWLAGRPELTSLVFGLLSGLAFLPFWIATTLDKRRGERWSEEGWVRRACTAMLRTYTRLGMGRDSNPMVMVFSTNIGERKGMLIVFIAMFGAMLGSTVQLALSRDQLGMGSYADFPDPRRGMASSLDGRSYASMQEPGRLPNSPFLPSPVSRGDYLLLVVPYVPMVHGELFARCRRQAEAATTDEDARRAQQLACVGAGLTVTLDGQAVAVGPEWYSDPRRDLRGLAWMLPVASLSKGRHELAVLPPAGLAEKRDAGPDEDAPQAWRIPFWR